MARHRGFTRQKFVKAVGSDLLREYFTIRNLSPPKQALGEEHVTALLGGLQEDVRRDIEEEFHCINDVADRGMDCLERAYDHYGLGLDEEWPREQAAMFLFLRSPDAFQMAYDLYLWRAVANTMSHHHLPEGDADFDDAKLTKLRESL
jgi:hypothetical protein